MSKIIGINNIKIKTHEKVYEPSEDSELLVNNLVNVKNKTVLDVGTGTGIQSINALINGAKKVIGIDINPYAIKLANENLKLNNFQNNKNIKFIESDLFSNINSSLKFDVILFNAPYLPTSEEEKLEKYLNYGFDGGPTGRVVVDKFINEVSNYLNKNGIVQIVQSSLTGEKETINLLYKNNILAKKTAYINFFYEEIHVITGKKQI